MRRTSLLMISLLLVGCDASPSLSPLQETCRQIALGRIKHPDSFKGSTATQEHSQNAQIIASLNFTAWNGYKVPVPYKIACRFEVPSDKSLPELLSIHWNGRPLRETELDEIRENYKLK